jgi:hypothetical protein
LNEPTCPPRARACSHRRRSLGDPPPKGIQRGRAEPSVPAEGSCPRSSPVSTWRAELAALAQLQLKIQVKPGAETPVLAVWTPVQAQLAKGLPPL